MVMMKPPGEQDNRSGAVRACLPIAISKLLPLPVHPRQVAAAPVDYYRAMASWSPGTQIGSYEILDVLGHGGMGKVFRVRHLITNRIEALKVIASSGGTSEEMLERFHREIRSLATLHHPNIAGLHTAFHHQEQLVMVMEYVQGTDLGISLKSGITLEQSLDFARQILRALEYAHSQGIIHRDIKPSNVMVTAAHQIKLLDFGLALSGQETRLTQAGSLVGSMHYVSPEQISGEPADVRSDLYAVGITLYELTTGRLPIEGTTHAQIIANHLQYRPTPPARLNPKIPEGVSAAVMKALAKDKEQRWQSASAFLQALDATQLGSASDLVVTTIGPEALSAEIAAQTSANPAAAGTRPSNPEGSRAALKPEALQEIATQLASHVGPIASVLVRRASSNAHDLRELCELVAKEIDSSDARQKFLRSVQTHLRASGQY
jgi:serine/threonine protein kinase